MGLHRGCGMRAKARTVANFSKCESGAATVEVVLWMPFLLLLIALIADASFLFNRQAQMYRTVQDVNRAYAARQLDTTEQVRDILIDLYNPVSLEVQADSHLDTSQIASGVIRTSLSIPARDVVSIGIIANLTNLNLTVSSQMYREF